MLLPKVDRLCLALQHGFAACAVWCLPPLLCSRDIQCMLEEMQLGCVDTLNNKVVVCGVQSCVECHLLNSQCCMSVGSEHMKV